YSGKHKRHTLKAQVVIDLERGQFLAVATGKGRTHDLRTEISGAKLSAQCSLPDMVSHEAA
ncbi:hypothetical protein H6F93_15950, partial [Leptolyngbya sp. FACHB-671]|nr:hypothetical protein [Leptolyngbya sp. FACHB-671]